jgi:hypothetical protein
LHELSVAYMEKNPGLTARYPNAFSNVHELVSWGMTHPGFQKDVLANLPMQGFNSTVLERVTTGLDAFFSLIAKVIFGARAKPDMENALGVLSANVSVLLEAAQTPSKSAGLSTLPMASTNPVDFSTSQVFAALGNISSGIQISPSFEAHLQRILSTVVETVYGNNPVLRNAALRTAPATPEDVYLQALAAQDTPFASKLSTLLPMGHQAGFVAELAELTLRAAIDTSPATRHEIRRIWAQARKEITPEAFYAGDWAQASAQSKAVAKNQWDLIFTIEQNTDKSSDYLSQFMAAALTYPPLFNALQGMSTGTVDGSVYDGKLIDKINLVFARILNLLSHLLTGTKKNQAGGAALATLAHHLATVEQKRMSSLDLDGDRVGNVVTKMSDSFSKASDSARIRIAAKADAIQKAHGNKFVQAIAGITATLAGDRVEQFWDFLFTLRDGVDGERYGWLASTINEARGVREPTEIAHLLLDAANTHEQNRKKIMIHTAAFGEESYDGPLDIETSKSLTRIVLRADLQSLLKSGFDVEQITRLLGDHKLIEREIAKLEAKLKGKRFYDYYLTAGKGLGYQMAQGAATVSNLTFNAHNIAYMLGTRDFGKVNDATAAAVIESLDPLISLYALKHSNLSDRNNVYKIAKSEGNRTDGNGFEATLRWHQRSQQDAEINLFAQDKYHMIKGYTKDIFNPHLDVIVANDTDGAMLKQAGYVEATDKPLKKDKADGTVAPTKMYVMNGRGLNSTQLGFLSNTGKRIKGQMIHGELVHPETGQANRKNVRVNRAVAYSKYADIESMYQNGESFDPSKVTDTYLVPVFNGRGEAVNYRYLMSEETKDGVMDRDNRLPEVMGQIAGSALDKAATPANNVRGIDALHAQYLDTFIAEPTAFVEFSGSSADPEIRERFRLLPRETRDYAEQLWGSDKIMVRKDTYDLAFGYRKYSLYDAFTKPDDQRKFMETMMVYLLGQVILKDDQGNETGRIGSVWALRLLRMENAWQEIVKEVKDILVIKNLWTLWGNEMSNFTLLALSGVPISKIIKNKVVAYQATIAYQAADDERAKLRIQLDTGYIAGGNQRALEQRLVELEDELQRSPVRVLVDAGMFQTLVEDVGGEDDPYSYKSRLTTSIDKYTGADSKSEVVQGARKVGKFVLMTHDSGIYKMLNKATILSDFTSRYVLYEHLTTRKKNPLDSHAALMQARASFVNYDVPTHRATQYLNDMGLVWFTKYYLRIQAVIFSTVRENPLGALSLLGLDELTGGFSDVLDSSMWSRWPLNLGSGPFDYPSALKELLTFQALEAAL